MTMLTAAIIAVVEIQFLAMELLLALDIAVTLFAFVLLCWLMMREHDRRVCEKCIHDVPLNPSEESKRLKWRFWLAHTGTEPQFLIPYAAVLVSTNFITDTTIGRMEWVAAQLSLVYLLVSQSTHRKLQPWCPWCSEGGGGSELDETPPVRPHDDRLLV